MTRQVIVTLYILIIEVFCTFVNHDRQTGATSRQTVEDESTVFTDMFPVNAAAAQSDPIRRAFAGDMFDRSLNFNLSNRVLCAVRMGFVSNSFIDNTHRPST